MQRREAERIAKKLGALMETGAKHNWAKVYWRGTLVSKFGIRHGNQSGHGHIPKGLYISETETLALATCTMSQDQYFARLREKGKLPDGTI